MSGMAPSHENAQRPTITTDRGERFLHLFLQYQVRIQAFLFTQLANEQDAEDVFQKASLVLWKKFDSFEPGGSFLAWACAVARYEVQNFLRVARRDRLRFGDALLETLADEAVVALEHNDLRKSALAECMKKLADADHNLVRRAYDQREAVKQVAEQLGLAVQTVYNRLHAIRRRLLVCIEHRVAEAHQP